MQELRILIEQISMIKQSLSGFLLENSEFKSLICILSAILIIHIFIIFKAYFGDSNNRGFLNAAILTSAFFDIFMLMLGLLAVVFPIIDKSKSLESIEVSTITIGFLLQVVKIMVDTFRGSIEVSERNNKYNEVYNKERRL